MPADPRVQQLIEEVLDSGITAEEVCRTAPELLPEVRKGLRKLLAVQAQVDSLFPEPGSVEAHEARPPDAGLPIVPGYVISEMLGHGGAGVVYRAFHQRLKRTVALKMLLAGSYAGPRERARFQREAEAVAALRHENIVQIYEVGDLGGRPYFTMEFVEGGSLSRHLAGVPRPGRQAAELLAPIARAVQFAHECGIIHRDLKPANILLQAANPGQGTPAVVPMAFVPKITDFGLAKLSPRPDRSESPATMPGSILGTPAYVAPEQVRSHGAAVGPASDVYSLGVILYEMMTGRPPFQGASAMETLVQATQLEPVPPSRLVPKLPLDLQTICLKCLEKDPLKRYPTAGALAADLGRYLRDEPILAKPAGKLESALRWSRRNRGVAVAMGVVALLLALLLAGSLLAAAHFRDLGIKQGKLAFEKDTALGKALRSEEREGGLRKLAEGRGQALRRNLYIAQMNLAGQAANSPSGLGRVSEQLADWEQDLPDLRDWEWYYLEGLGHRDKVTLRGHLGGVQDVAWSPDGRRLASAGSEGTAYLWDAAGSEELKGLHGHAGLVASVAWSPDGRRLATASWDSTIKVWDSASGRELSTLRGHDGPIFSVAWSADGTRLASGGADRTVRVWDAETGAAVRVLLGHSQAVSGVAWRPDGKRLASCGRDTTVRVWDAESGAEIRRLLGHTNWVNRVAWSPDGARLGSASNDLSARVWDPESGAELLALRGHAQGVISVGWSPDGTRLVTGGEDQTVKVWEAAGGPEVFTLRGHTSNVLTASWSPDGTRLASASTDGTVKVWDGAANPETPHLRGHDGPIHAVAWGRGDGPALASASTDGTVRIWDPARGEVRRTLRGHDGLVRAVAWSPDGTRLASSGIDQTIRVWDAARGEELACLRGHAGEVLDVSWSPDRTRLASAGADATVRIWDVARGREVHICRGHDSQVYSVAWSPDGTRLVSASRDKTLKVWDASTGKESSTNRSHSAEVTSVAWSPDGRRLASAGYDQTVRISDAGSGGEIRTLRGHTSRVNEVAWNPAGTRLASASTDRTVKVWDVATGRETLTLGGHLDQVNAVAWSPDGMTVVSAGFDRSILVHDATVGYLAARAPACLPLLARRLAANPGDGGLWRLRAEVHAGRGDWEAAAADVRKYLALERGRRWIILGAWAAGPYPADLSASYPPEESPNPDRTVARGVAPPVGRTWQAIVPDPRGFVDFAPMYGKAGHISAYVLLRVYSPEKHPVAILLGSDDQVRLWLNGARIHESLIPRTAKPDEDAIPATLEPGWNMLLARVANEQGEHALFLRLSDTPEDLGRTNGTVRSGGPTP